MVKSTNGREYKERVFLTVDNGVKGFFHENRLNMSEIANAAFCGLKTIIEEVKSPNSVQIALNLSKYGKIEWTRCDSNARPPPCQGDLDTSSVPANDTVSPGFEKFSNLAHINKKGLTDNDSEIPSSNVINPVRGYTGTLADYYALYRDEFRQWYARQTGKSGKYVTAATIKTADSALMRFGALFRTPDDIETYYLPPKPDADEDDETIEGFSATPLSEKFHKALNRFVTFLDLHADDSDPQILNGKSLSKFQSAASHAASAVSTGNEARDISTASLYAWRDSLVSASRSDVTMWYLMAYSGARLSQLYQFLSMSPDARARWIEVITPDSDTGTRAGLTRDVLRVDGKRFESDRKGVKFWYFPRMLEDVVRNYRPGWSDLKGYAKRMKPKMLNETPELIQSHGGVITLKTLRKWLNNRCMKEGNLTPLVAGWIEGHTPSAFDGDGDAKITLLHYTELDDRAAAGYSEVEQILTKILPIPDWLTQSEHVRMPAKKPTSAHPPESAPEPKPKKHKVDPNLLKLAKKK